MNILILGEGAREHALGWKLKQQKECSSIFIHPGNAGTLFSGFDNFGSTSNRAEIIQRASEETINLVVIGPEALLEKGYADAFRDSGFLVVGPNQSAARLETSKIFAKQFLVEAEIPTAPFQIFNSQEELESFRPEHWPWVFKLDGLAAGKGVLIAQSQEDILSFSKSIWNDRVFGPGPHRVLAEAFLKGQEISYIGFCDGNSFVPLESATDYKKIFDNHQGPNTGGMGAISPSPHFSPSLKASIDQLIITPLLKTMKKRKIDFRGVLFIGLMIDPELTPQVLEFNTRFGDPETQSVLPRLNSSLLTLLLDTARGELFKTPIPQWNSNTSVYVVACTQGYPSSPQKGDVIEGIETLPLDASLFFGGITRQKDRFVTDGGRVLGVGSLGASSNEARKKAYTALNQIHWRGMHYRKDIGL